MCFTDQKFTSIRYIITKAIVIVNETPAYTLLTTHFFQNLAKTSICIKKPKQKTHVTLLKSTAGQQQYDFSQEVTMFALKKNK